MKIDVGDGVRLFADVDGAEWVPDGARMRRRPVLVLLHGGPGMDHSSFELELDSLREIAQLVFIDHRGNGRSDDGPREKWNLDQWGDDVRSVCEVLGIEAPVVMGQSFGGFVAQAYATRHPEHPADPVHQHESGEDCDVRVGAVVYPLVVAENFGLRSFSKILGIMGIPLTLGAGLLMEETSGCLFPLFFGPTGVNPLEDERPSPRGRAWRCCRGARPTA